MNVPVWLGGHGSPRPYCSEVRCGGLWGLPADVHALGALLFQLLTGGALPVETQTGLDLSGVLEAEG
jgi:hypothetical protein